MKFNKDYQFSRKRRKDYRHTLKSRESRMMNEWCVNASVFFHKRYQNRWKTADGNKNRACDKCLNSKRI
jgi:hypothetical protein